MDKPREEHILPDTMQRRGFIAAALGGTALSFAPPSLAAKPTASAVATKARIVIAGGGAAGLTAASR